MSFPLACAVAPMVSQTVPSCDPINCAVADTAPMPVAFTVHVNCGAGELGLFAPYVWIAAVRSKATSGVLSGNELTGLGARLNFGLKVFEDLIADRAPFFGATITRDETEKLAAAIIAEG